MYQEFTKKEMKKSKRLAFVAGLALMSVSFSLSGQNVHNLNGDSPQMDAYLNPTEETPPQEFLENAKACRSFAINPVLQNQTSVEIGDSVDLQLFEGKNYRAVVNGAYTDVNGNFTIVLKLPDYPTANGFITTSQGGKSLFSVSIPELKQEFVSKGSIYSPTDFLIELEESVDTNLRDDYIEIPDETPEEEAVEDDYQDEGMLFERDGTPDVEADSVPCYRDPNLKGTDPVVIDLMIVYTPAAENWANTTANGITNALAGAMAKTAEVMATQKNGDTVRLVHSALVNYTEFETDAMSTDLDRLRGTSDGYMDEVHQWRKEHNADVVALFEFYPNTVGGLGYVLSDTVKGRYEYAFNVCRIQQAYNDYTSIHEMGHNLGMRHDRENNSSGTSLYPYGLGWRWYGNSGTQWRSVMAYAPGTRTPYYSNPDELYDGVPTGNDTSNNARVFRNTKHIIAFYSEILHNLPDKPANVVASNPTNNGATFSWDAVEGAATYRVVNYSTGSYFTTPNTTYTLNYSSWCQPCSTYTVGIRALNSCGDVSDMSIITFMTKCPDDPTVTTLPATDTTQNSAVLHKTVTDNGDAVLSEGFSYKEISADTWQTSQNGILTGLTPNTQYRFYAYATTSKATYNGSVLTFRTLSPSPCNAPTNLSVPNQNITVNSVVINWSGDANEYLVEYKIQANAAWTTHTPNPTTTAVTLSSLTEDTEYNVRIKAICDEYSESGYSNIVTFKTIKDVSIAEANADDLVQIFPNPVTNELFITSKLNIDKVELYTLSSILLMTENNFKGKILLSDLAASVYMLKVYTEKGVVVSKIVKE